MFAKRVSAAGLVLMAGLCLGAVVPPQVSIRDVSLSPQILLQMYNSRNASSLGWTNPNIFRMLVYSSDEAGHLRFDVEIYDRRTLVAAARNFQVLGETLHQGDNRYDANDISASGLEIFFNDKYQPSTDAGSLAQGNILPMSSYQVVIRPMDPRGDSLTLNLTLSTPQSALNLPPIPVYPRDVEVDSVLPNFIWTSVPKAAAYEVAVGPEPNPETNAYWKSGRLQGTQALYASSARALENGVKYFWQVRAFDALGNPVGGVDGRSQPAAFSVRSSAKAVASISPAEVEAVLKTAISDSALFSDLEGYQPVAVETDAGDAADLLRQLREGSAKVISARVE